jgi:hypothetical protein
MDAVHVNGDTILTGMDAIIDTGTQLIIGDSENVAAFYQRIPGSEDLGDGFYTGAFRLFHPSPLTKALKFTASPIVVYRSSLVPCEGLSNMSLAFGGSTFAIDPSTFILGPMADKPGCLASLIGVPMEPPLGKSLVIYVYTFFLTGFLSALGRGWRLLAERVYRVRSWTDSRRVCNTQMIKRISIPAMYPCSFVFRALNKLGNK